MELLDNLALGLATAATWQNLLFCLVGVTIGTLVGVLPGISPLTTVAMLLPFTFGLPPASAMIMLAGIFYGAQYGSSTAAILEIANRLISFNKHRHDKLLREL